uniref:Uncharacterized protein n=1 Tax=Anguilla anguilla TaxID=7936 RepID=A0A0E9T297_ANGAN
MLLKGPTENKPTPHHCLSPWRTSADATEEKQFPRFILY